MVIEETAIEVATTVDMASTVEDFTAVGK
jgi:hypothetical protein